MFGKKSARRFTLFIFFATCCWSQVITTVAGGGWRAFPTSDIPATSAPLGSLWSPALDSQGNIYVADFYNNIVVRISPSGTLSLVAGNGKAGFGGDGGAATGASLDSPTGVALDSLGNLYIADYNNNRIRKVTGGVITTVAGNGVGKFAGDSGPAIAASLNQPQGLAIDGADNLYIADQFNCRVRKITNGIITTVAGNGNCKYSGDNGSATNAMLFAPSGVAVDSAGVLYIADQGNNRIRKVSGGVITTVAGNGVAGFSGDGVSATSASLSSPQGVAVDSAGNLYIADYANQRIRKVSGGNISTVAGNGVPAFVGDGGTATAASLYGPNGVAVDSKGNILIAEFVNERLRVVANGIISTVAGQGGGSYFGDGQAPLGAGLVSPNSAVVDSAGNLYISDSGNNAVRKVSGGIITTFAGNGVAGFSGDGGPANRASLNAPQGLAIDAAGNLYIADANNSRVRKVSNGIITTVAGTGAFGFSSDGIAATSASLNSPLALAVDASGNNLYISDSGNNRIRRVTGGTITTFAGNGVAGYSGDQANATGAKLNLPAGIALDSAGSLYIADVINYRIRKVSNGTITTVAGTGTEGYSGDGPAVTATFNRPRGLALDAAGNLYVADETSNRIRKIAAGMISTVAGNGFAVFAGDGGLALNASLSNPQGVAVDGAGSLYIVDTFANRIRKVLNTSPSYQVAPTLLSFTTSEGGTTPDPQQLSLSSAVPGLTFSSSTGAPWLTVTPASGSIPTTLQVKVDPTGLAAGSYSGTITITSPNAATAATTVAVSFNIQPALVPQLSLGSQSLSFGVVQGGTAQTGQVEILDSGGGSVAFSAVPATASGGSWLSVSANSGRTTPANPFFLTVTADPGSLPPGTYQGSISITGAGTTSTVAVTLSIASPTAITVLSQSGLSFRAVTQGGSPLPLTFGILNQGKGAMSWSATPTTLPSGANWLHISPTSGTVTQPFVDVSTVTVSVDPTGLAPGDYYGQVKVVAPALNSPQFLTVILTILPANSTLAPDVSAPSLIFTGIAGSSPSSQDITIANPTAQPNSYISASTGKGFTYLPAAATVLPNQPVTLRVFPDFSNFQPGEVEHGTVTLKFIDGTSTTVSVLLLAAPAPSPASGLAPRDTKTCAKTLEITVQSPKQNFAAALGQPIPVVAWVQDDCGTAFTSTSGSITADLTSPNASCNSLTYIGTQGSSGVWNVTCMPTKPVSGPFSVYLTAFAGVANGTATVTGTLSTSKTPSFTASDIVHSASFIAGAPIAPCGLITIKGSNLADGDQSANAPLPLTLNGTTVSLGDLVLPILYTSPEQLNVQVPCGTPFNSNGIQLNVTRGTQATVTVPQSLVVAQGIPGIFTVGQDGLGQADVYHGNSEDLAQPGNPALVGETVVIYCTGLGAVDNPVPDGTGAPLSPLSRTLNPVTVTIDGLDAPVSFSGLAPLGAPGVYQVNAQVPLAISNDAAQIVVTVAGQTSRPATMAVQSK